MVNLENREFLMDMNYTDMLLFSHNSVLPHIVEEHISVDAFLGKTMLDRYMLTKGPNRPYVFNNLTTKSKRRLKFKIYTDSPEGIDWDGKQEK